MSKIHAFRRLCARPGNSHPDHFPAKHTNTKEPAEHLMLAGSFWEDGLLPLRAFDVMRGQPVLSYDRLNSRISLRLLIGQLADPLLAAAHNPAA